MASRPWSRANELRRLVVLGVCVTVAWFAFAPSSVGAQSNDVFFELEACRADPDSEECICGRVRAFSMYPTLVHDPGPPEQVVPLDLDGDTFAPSFDSALGIWVDDPNEGNNTDLTLMPTDDYGQNCALSYFREDLRRLWYFAVALGGAFASVSFVWVGVAYMQSSSSGADLSRTRAMMMRVLVGLILLACAYVIWEFASGELMGLVDFWSLDPYEYYDFN